ncbi:MAG: transposase [Rhabdochlamydiaceae bacterium]
MGSLNSLEQLQDSSSLRKHIGADLPSADTLGRVFNLISADTIRAVNHAIYERLKRNKALQPPWHGLMALAIDGHESHATYKRHCSGCLERKVGTGDSKRIQYYHRNVTAQLISNGICFQLDAEPQLPGEDEVAAAVRLLERVIPAYPRAFDVVLADALYGRSDFFNFIVGHGKDAVVVLKANCPELLADAKYCFDGKPPTCVWKQEKKTTEAWDEVGFESGPRLKKPLRVVKSQETKEPVKRQLDETIEVETSTWMWMTTLSTHRAGTKAVVELGHSRWSIENHCFNELASRWHSDHVYKHDSAAILNFWLLSLLSSNLFQAFFLLNLKPDIRDGKSMLHFARMIASELYACLPVSGGVPP